MFVWAGLLALLLFSIIPMLGVVIAFKNYNIKTGFWGMFTAPWVGLEHFVAFVNDRSQLCGYRNNQGNTREGLHAASAGGTWQCVTLGYCGMGISEDGGLAFVPNLPENKYAIWSMANPGQAANSGSKHRTSHPGSNAASILGSWPVPGI